MDTAKFQQGYCQQGHGQQGYCKKKKNNNNFEVAYHIPRYWYAQTRFTRTGIGGRAILKK